MNAIASSPNAHLLILLRSSFVPWTTSKTPLSATVFIANHRERRLNASLTKYRTEKELSADSPIAS